MSRAKIIGSDFFFFGATALGVRDFILFELWLRFVFLPAENDFFFLAFNGGRTSSSSESRAGASSVDSLSSEFESSLSKSSSISWLGGVSGPGGTKIL